MSSIQFFSILGGAGGKGTWGKLGCELELPWVDPNDPNYESDGDENIVNEAPASLPTKNGGQPHVNGKAHGHGTTLKTMVPEMSEEDVNKGTFSGTNYESETYLLLFNSSFLHEYRIQINMNFFNSFSC